MPPIKRQKTTPPHKRGMPPNHDKSAPEGRLEVEKTMSEETDPKDSFNNLISILCNVRADWKVKRRVLVAIEKLVDVLQDNELLEKVANRISDLVETRK